MLALRLSGICTNDFNNRKCFRLENFAPQQTEPTA